MRIVIDDSFLVKATREYVSLIYSMTRVTEWTWIGLGRQISPMLSRPCNKTVLTFSPFDKMI